MYAKVSAPTTVTSGTVNPLRADNLGSLVVQASGGKYYDLVTAGRVFVVANQAAVATTAAMATTWTGLCVSNPPTSNINIALLKFGAVNTVACPTATNIGLMTGFSTTAIAASLTPRNRYVGNSAGTAVATASATLPATPVLEQVFMTGGTLATTGNAVGSVTDIDLDGSLVLPPGGFVATYSFAANTAAWIFSFMWAEIPR